MIENIVRKIHVLIMSLGSVVGIEVIDYIQANELIKVTGQSVIIILTIIYFIIKIRYNLKKK